MTNTQQVEINGLESGSAPPPPRLDASGNGIEGGRLDAPGDDLRPRRLDASGNGIAPQLDLPSSN